MSKKMVKIVAIVISAVFIIGLLFSAIYGIAYADTLQDQLKKADQKKQQAQTKMNNAKK